MHVQLLALQALQACHAQLAAAIAADREDTLEAAIAQARAQGVNSTAAALRLEELVEKRLSLTRQKHEARELRRAQLLLELDAMVSFVVFFCLCWLVCLGGFVGFFCLFFAGFFLLFLCDFKNNINAPLFAGG
jgi:hypothetical protein